MQNQSKKDRKISIFQSLIKTQTNPLWEFDLKTADFHIWSTDSCKKVSKAIENMSIKCTVVCNNFRETGFLSAAAFVLISSLDSFKNLNKQKARENSKNSKTQTQNNCALVARNSLQTTVEELTFAHWPI